MGSIAMRVNSASGVRQTIDPVPEPLKRHGVSLVLVADTMTGRLRRHGDGVAPRWLVMGLFGTPLQIRATAAACKGPLVPAGSAREQDVCLVTMPTEDLLVSLVVAGVGGDVRARAELRDRLEQVAAQLDWRAMAPSRPQTS